MKAVQPASARIAYSELAFAELVLWRLAKPLEGSAHAFKYRPAYVCVENAFCDMTKKLAGAIIGISVTRKVPTLSLRQIS